MEGEAGREAAACGLYMWVLKPRGSQETLDLFGGLMGRDKWAVTDTQGLDRAPRQSIWAQ
jgi:hypothetical protein